MESAQFWRDLETRFRGLQGPTRDLHASTSDESPARHVEEQAEHLASRFQEPDFPLEEIEQWATRIFHIARWIVDEEYITRWTLCGRGVDEPSRLLKAAFVREAELAAAGLGTLRAAATGAEAVDHWLDQVRTAAPEFCKFEGDWIDNLPLASAETCKSLATVAYRTSTIVSSPALNGGGRSAVVTPILEQKGWSTLRWAQEASVSYNVAKDYLTGRTKKVRPSTRKELAGALGLGADELPE